MLKSNQILKSKKRQGIYENVIISKIEVYFKNLGYDVVSHARFNIAWGSIISDVDILLIKGNKLTVVEVKSSRDNIMKAEHQIRKIEDFVDEVFLACDFLPKKIPCDTAGFIFVNGEKIEILRTPKILTKKPSVESLMLLHKSSLGKLLGLKSIECNKESKSNLVSMVQEIDSDTLKSQLKEIITCQ